MSATDPKPLRESVGDIAYTVIAARLRPWWWLTPLVVVVAGVLAFLGGVLGQPSDQADGTRLRQADDWLWLVAGAFGTVLVGAYTGLRSWASNRERRRELADERQRELEELSADSRLRLALRNGLQPLSEHIAYMETLSPKNRKSALDAVARDAAAALRQVLEGVDQLRIVVYRLDEPGEVMEPLAYQGRGGARPSPFVKAENARGESAINLVLENRTLFVEDLDTQESDDYMGSGEEYQTFISTSINDGLNAYGMLTVDAPEPGSLTTLDTYLVEVIANLLGIAFAIEQAGRSPKR